MKRIERHDLECYIYVAIKCAPKLVINRLRGQRPIESDQAARELTDLIMRHVDNDHRGVFDWGPPPTNLFPSLDSFPPNKEPS